MVQQNLPSLQTLNVEKMKHDVVKQLFSAIAALKDSVHEYAQLSQCHSRWNPNRFVKVEFVESAQFDAGPTLIMQASFHTFRNDVHMELFELLQSPFSTTVTHVGARKDIALSLCTIPSTTSQSTSSDTSTRHCYNGSGMQACFKPKDECGCRSNADSLATAAQACSDAIRSALPVRR